MLELSREVPLDYAFMMWYWKKNNTDIWYFNDRQCTMIGGLDPPPFLSLVWFLRVHNRARTGDWWQLFGDRLDCYSLRPTLDNVRLLRDLDLLDPLFQNILDPVGSKSWACADHCTPAPPPGMYHAVIYTCSLTIPMWSLVLILLH